MQLKKGASVESSAGEKIGTLDRVVLDPETKEVTHIIVEKGWLFTENKVIQIQDVAHVDSWYRLLQYRFGNDVQWRGIDAIYVPGPKGCPSDCIVYHFLLVNTA